MPHSTPHILAADFCVIASSSSGNASLLRLTTSQGPLHILIDAGLSPRRTLTFINSLSPLHAPAIDHVILTHLDVDHWHPGWLPALPAHTTVHIHRRHRGRAERAGLLYLRTSIFESPFQLCPGLTLNPLLVAHDDLGTAAFVFEFTSHARRLGFATDTGTLTPHLCDHLKGVDVLAIESNYCPQMQLASPRPAFLKDRIMNGRGHLSNQQSARAVAAISPREAIILLHLSRECNSPLAALAAHQCPHHSPTHTWPSQPLPSIILAHAAEPTPFIPIAQLCHLFQAPAPPPPAPYQPLLFATPHAASLSLSPFSARTPISI